MAPAKGICEERSVNLALALTRGACKERFVGEKNVSYLKKLKFPSCFLKIYAMVFVSLISFLGFLEIQPNLVAKNKQNFMLL